MALTRRMAVDRMAHDLDTTHMKERVQVSTKYTLSTLYSREIIDTHAVDGCFAHRHQASSPPESHPDTYRIISWVDLHPASDAELPVGCYREASNYNKRQPLAADG